MGSRRCDLARTTMIMVHTACSRNVCKRLTPHLFNTMRNDTDTILEAGRQLASTDLPDGSCPVSANKLRSIERYLPRPYRSRGTFKAANLDSLSKFITKHRAPDHEILASWRWGKLTVILNFHTSPQVSGWCDYKVTCWCRYSDACNKLTHDVLMGAYKVK